MTESPNTLADLVSPLGQEEFLGLLRERRLAFRPGAKTKTLTPSLGWQALRRMIGTMNWPTKRSDDIRVLRESALVASDQWMTDGKPDVGKLDKLLAQGFSIVIVHVDEQIPALAALRDDIVALTSEGSYIGAIVTSGAARGAFKVHFDPEDLVILQTEGTKRWQVFGPPAPSPVRGMPKPRSQPDAEPIFDEVLEPGDLLFVPAGNWHRCECGLSTSVHLGIFFLPPTPWHAVNALARSLLEDEAFRTPLTRLEGRPALDATEAELKRRLVDRIGTLQLSEFIAEWHKIAY